MTDHTSDRLPYVVAKASHAKGSFGHAAHGSRGGSRRLGYRDDQSLSRISLPVRPQRGPWARRGRRVGWTVRSDKGFTAPGHIARQSACFTARHTSPKGALASTSTTSTAGGKRSCLTAS